MIITELTVIRTIRYAKTYTYDNQYTPTDHIYNPLGKNLLVLFYTSGLLNITCQRLRKA